MIQRAQCYIATLVMAIMLLVQLGVAQHSAVHFAEHFDSTSIESNHSDHHDHGDHHNDRDNNEEHTSLECDICLMAQSLSLAFINKHSFLTRLVVANHAPPKTDSYIARVKHGEFYSPRAPPLLLI